MPVSVCVCVCVSLVMPVSACLSGCWSAGLSVYRPVGMSVSRSEWAGVVRGMGVVQTGEWGGAGNGSRSSVDLDLHIPSPKATRFADPDRQ